jgi:hypothetical protein
MAGRIAIALACLAIFHTPDGFELRVDTRHIAAVRPAAHVKQHLAPGTNSVVYVTTNNFGIVETVDQAQQAIRNCVDGDPPPE